MNMTEVVAVPLLSVEASKDEVRSLDTSGALEKGSSKNANQIKTTCHAAGQDHIHLGGLVAFGGLKELRKKGSKLTGQAAGEGLGWQDMFDIAPAQGNKNCEIYFTAVCCCLPTQIDKLNPPRWRFCTALVIGELVSSPVEFS
jgi:hypothetical protein